MFSAFCYYQLHEYDNNFSFFNQSVYDIESILSFFVDFRGIFVLPCSGRAHRVTIRLGFTGHVLCFGFSPGGFSKIGGLSRFLAQSASTFERC